jgi:hypothetical protein
MDCELAVERRGHCKHTPKLAIQIPLVVDKFPPEHRCPLAVAEEELHLYQWVNLEAVYDDDDGYDDDDYDDDILVYCLKR